MLAPPASSAPSGKGSRIAFHGWSPDSRYVAYTRIRNRPPPKRGGKPVVDRQRRHRRIVDGDFAGFGSASGGNVSKHARTKGYLVRAFPARSLTDHTIAFDAGDRLLTMAVSAEDEHIAWSLRDRDIEIARHFFDALYVSVEVDLYPAPDGTQGVVIMHLDTGWVTDAAIYPVRLYPKPPPVLVRIVEEGEEAQ